MGISLLLWVIDKNGFELLTSPLALWQNLEFNKFWLLILKISQVQDSFLYISRSLGTISYCERAVSPFSWAHKSKLNWKEVHVANWSVEVTGPFQLTIRFDLLLHKSQVNVFEQYYLQRWFLKEVSLNVMGK